MLSLRLGEVRIWDMRTRSMISHLKEHSGRVVALAVLDGDQHVAGAEGTLSDRCKRKRLIWTPSSTCDDLLSSQDVR